jgi:16S rRNA (cytosine1402-N4)-methyltransferase
MWGISMARAHEHGADGAEGPVHEPVLAAEVTRWLGGDRPAALEGWIVDATLGAGGHASRLLAALPNVRLIGIDQDPAILPYASRALQPFERRVRVRRGRLSQLSSILDEEGVSRVCGMLFDLGASSLQLDSSVRGFSFGADGPLDMRMDPDRERTAAEIVNHWDEDDLADLFFYEGGETRSRKIARAIVESRRRAPFHRTLALADLIERTVGRSGKTHPATRVFQALRRAVNEEGEELLAGLEAAERWLVDGGRLAVISFHSGEDGEVKRFFAQGAELGRWQVLTRKPVTAANDEIASNRRSRSALLRVASRVRRGNGNGNGHGHAVVRGDGAAG